MAAKNLKRLRSVIVLTAVAAAACGGEVVGVPEGDEDSDFARAAGGDAPQAPAGGSSSGQVVIGTGGGSPYLVGTGGVVGLPELGGSAGAAGSGPFDDDVEDGWDNEF